MKLKTRAKINFIDLLRPDPSSRPPADIQMEIYRWMYQTAFDQKYVTDKGYDWEDVKARL